MVKFFIENNAEMIDVKNDGGETPLFLAVKNNGKFQFEKLFWFSFLLAMYLHTEANILAKIYYYYHRFTEVAKIHVLAPIAKYDISCTNTRNWSSLVLKLSPNLKSYHLNKILNLKNTMINSIIQVITNSFNLFLHFLLTK